MRILVSGSQERGETQVRSDPDMENSSAQYAGPSLGSKPKHPEVTCPYVLPGPQAVVSPEEADPHPFPEHA